MWKKKKLRQNDLDVNLVIPVNINLQYIKFHENVLEMCADKPEHSL